MMGYEGHPILWHLILWFPARCGLPFFTIKLINLVIITGAVSLFLYKAPFKLKYKLPVVFSYYFFFEYGIIARSYSLSVLLLLVVAALYASRFKRPLLFSFALVLLAHTCVYFFFIAGALLLLYTLELLKAGQLARICNLTALAIGGMGLLLVFWQLLPPADLSPLLKNWQVSMNFKKYLNGIYFLGIASFFPLPPVELRFWNNELLYNETFKFAGLFILLFTFILLPKREPFLLYALAVLIIYVIHIFKYALTIHHFGLVYFMFLFCLWISRDYQSTFGWVARIRYRIGQLAVPVPVPAPAPAPAPGLRLPLLPLLLGGVLGLHIFASAVSFYFDYRYDFSPGRSIAHYLREKGYLRDDILIAFHPSSVAASILPYLDSRQKFYYLEYQDFGSYMIWNATYEEARYLSLPQLIFRVYNGLSKKPYRKLLLILDRDIFFNARIDKRMLFVKVIVGDERLRLYDFNLLEGLPVFDTK
jgi:hypothetical protein